jgi:transposase
MNKTIVPDAKNKAPESPQSNAQPGASAAPSATRYDEAFKRQTVEHWIKTGKPGTQIAREIGVSYPSLKDWKRRYYGHAVPEREDLAAEIRALKSELARVTEQRDILKKTLGIFSQPSSNATNASRK